MIMTTAKEIAAEIEAELQSTGNLAVVDATLDWYQAHGVPRETCKAALGMIDPHSLEPNGESGGEAPF